MSKCLVTKLPVEVSGDWEKLGYFMFKKSGDNNVFISAHVIDHFYIAWNEYSTFYTSGGAVSPHELPSIGYEPPVDLSLQFGSATGTSYPADTFTAWMERDGVSALSFDANVIIPENKGFEQFLEESSTLDYLQFASSNTINYESLKGNRIKCLKCDGTQLQPYICQNIVNNLKGLVYIFFFSPSNGSAVDSTITRNVIYPDNLIYIRNAPTKIEHLSANCEECVVNSNTVGAVEDFIEKAVAAGRSSGTLSCSGRASLSSHLTYNNSALATVLSNQGITTNNFIISWLNDGNTVSFSSQVESQLSSNIAVNNYMNLLDE